MAIPTLVPIFDKSLVSDVTLPMKRPWTDASTNPKNMTNGYRDVSEVMDIQTKNMTARMSADGMRVFIGPRYESAMIAGSTRPGRPMAFSKRRIVRLVSVDVPKTFLAYRLTYSPISQFLPGITLTHICKCKIQCQKDTKHPTNEQRIRRLLERSQLHPRP